MTHSQIDDHKIKQGTCKSSQNDHRRQRNPQTSRDKKHKDHRKIYQCVIFYGYFFLFRFRYTGCRIVKYILDTGHIGIGVNFKLAGETGHIKIFLRQRQRIILEMRGSRRIQIMDLVIPRHIETQWQKQGKSQTKNHATAQE